MKQITTMLLAGAVAILPLFVNAQSASVDIETSISSESEVVVSSFEDCVALGNPVMESNPPRCAANGRVFVQGESEVRVNTRDENRQQTREEMANRRAEVQDRAAEVRANAEVQAETRRAEAQDRRAEVQAQVEARKAELLARQEQKRAEVQAQIEERREERRARFSERAQTKIDEVIDRLSKRYQAGLERLTGISTRIQTRIDELEEEGYDMSEAQTRLDHANDLLVDAESLIVKAQVISQAVLEVDDYASAWIEVKTSYEQGKANLKEIRETLREVIKIMKDTVGTETTVNASANAAVDNPANSSE